MLRVVALHIVTFTFMEVGNERSQAVLHYALSPGLVSSSRCAARLDEQTPQGSVQATLRRKLCRKGHILLDQLHGKMR
jgi:hypothetical protein